MGSEKEIFFDPATIIHWTTGWLAVCCSGDQNTAAGLMMASSSFTRYSLKSLAELDRSPQSSRQLLESVVERLQCQLASDFLTIPHHHHQKKKNNVDTLVYIHRDTCRLAEQLLASQRPWQRFSTADQFLINGTLTQIAARHSKTLETVVQIVEQQQQQEYQPQPTPPGGSSSINDGDHDAAADHDHDALHHDSAERFLQQRLGIQLLCHHYGELVKDRPGGAINQDLFVNDFIDDAISESKQIVEAHLGEAPSVHVVTTGPRIRTRFVQCWLQHSLVELLKTTTTTTLRRRMMMLWTDHNYRRLNYSSFAPRVTPSLRLRMPARVLRMSSKSFASVTPQKTNIGTDWMSNNRTRPCAVRCRRSALD
jgi:hypothetical protein